MMSRKICEHQHAPDNPLPDISQLVTTRLKPRQTPAETHAREIAQHETEIQRLVELAVVLEQAVTALVIRVQMTSKPQASVKRWRIAAMICSVSRMS